MKAPLSLRLARAASRVVAAPLHRLADELQQLRTLYTRDLQHRGVIDDDREHIDAAALAALEAARGVAARDEWEIAIDEHVAEKRRAEERE